MPILNFKVEQVGQAGVFPAIIYILTDDTLAEVTTTGYLNGIARGNIPLSDADMALVTTKTSPSASSIQVGWLEVSKSGENWSLVPPAAPGSVVLPTIANHIATYTNTLGTLSEDAATAINGGNIQAGLSGTAGYFASFPATAARGSLRLVAANNTGDTVTQITNAAMGQATVLTVPDPAAATANFLLDAGTANILAMQEFVSINEVLSFGTGTWTTTRIAQGNYVKRHTAADETSIIGIDITPMIRVAASKGFRLDSFDVIYSIATLAMDAHTLTLDRIAYANNVAVSVTSIPLTGSLSTATQANPYLTNISVTTPAFDVTADSKYVIEVTANNAATTAYDFYGIMLRFSQTIA
jgi:hypothetical protein